MIDRRTFLQSSLALAGAAACASSGSGRTGGAPKKRLEVLVLGGTGFIGPHIVEDVRARGHKVTLFNRGKTNPGLFTDVEQLHGDRDGDLKSLEGRKWDAVVDTSGFVPRIVRASAQLLAPNVGQYIFVSTISVYASHDVDKIDEQSEVLKLAAGEENSEDSRKNYGPLKALCEQEVMSAFGARGTVVRPGLIVGPRDPTDRFTYWPVRIDRGGDVLAPGDGTDPMEFIDGRDLSRWIVRLAEDRTGGTYNAVGPAKTLTTRELLETCQKATTTPSNLVWVGWPFLEKQEVAPWGDLPGWVPAHSEARGFALVSSAAGQAKGLTFRPVADTVKDTLAWWKSQPEERRAKLGAGLSSEKEQAVLTAWRAAGQKA